MNLFHALQASQGRAGACMCCAAVSYRHGYNVVRLVGNSRRNSIDKPDPAD